MKRLYQDSLHLEGYQSLDMAVFIKNIKGEYLWANDFFIQKSAGHQSVSEIFRKQDHHFTWHEFADNLKMNDNLLIETKECVTVRERILRHDGNYVNLLSKKSPIFDKQDKLVALIGFCMEIPIATAAKFLSKREYAAISLLAQGNTDKQIGKKLCISPRTVETHINNAKIKLNATTRAELIVKCLV
jgi:DNA-binding CsgD family transcriptional regulator